VGYLYLFFKITKKKKRKGKWDKAKQKGKKIQKKDRKWKQEEK
jgi:hypothetical protein